MRPLKIRYTLILAGLILLLSFFSLLLNHYIYKFPGNNYFPDNIYFAVILLLIFNLGLIIAFGKNSKQSRLGTELFYFFAVMSVIALATNAIQLTPFPAIDSYILSLETQMNINLAAVLAWTNQYLNFKLLLIRVYETLPYQMSILPLCIIATGRIQLIRNYYFLLLSTTLLGFIFYYFFPTTAPASIINSPLFSNDQIATGLKFNQIHNHIPPTTNDGGLIALPSFHVIWSLLCVYLLKEWIIPCVLLSIVNSLLIASCVLLGWHYPIDVLAGIGLVAICYFIMEWCKST